MKIAIKDVLLGYRFLLLRAESLRREAEKHYSKHPYEKPCADQLNAEADKAEGEARKIREAIDAIPEDLPRQVMHLRFIEGVSLLDIEERLFYSRTTVMKLNARGLALMEKIYYS